MQLLWFLTSDPGNIKCNLLLKVAGCFRTQKNACRDITRLIRRTPGTILKIAIDVCKVMIKVRKPLRKIQVWWPYIRMDTWCKYFLEYKPQLLLGGHTIDGDWQGTFTKFWSLYRQVDSSHPVFRSGYSLESCVPYYIHGDEGRGQLKRPYMVISWQTVVGHGGMDVCNDSACLVCVNETAETYPNQMFFHDIVLIHTIA